MDGRTNASSSSWLCCFFAMKLHCLYLNPSFASAVRRQGLKITKETKTKFVQYLHQCAPANEVVFLGFSFILPTSIE